MPDHACTLRRATPDDASDIAELFLRTRRECLPYLPQDLHTDEETRGFIAGHVVGELETWVAEAGGCIVGFAALREKWLDHLYVLPEFHGRGVGSALLARAKERLPGGFFLWTFQKNLPARAFYEARGLTLVTETDGADNEEREPDALYLWLPPGATPIEPA